MKKNKTHPDIHWRESIVSKVLSKEELKARWKKINYKPEHVQLKLEI